MTVNNVVINSGGHGDATVDFTLALPGQGSATAEQLSRDITDFLADEDPDAGFRGRLNALLSAEQDTYGRNPNPNPNPDPDKLLSPRNRSSARVTVVRPRWWMR